MWVVVRHVTQNTHRMKIFVLVRGRERMGWTHILKILFRLVYYMGWIIEKHLSVHCRSWEPSSFFFPWSWMPASTVFIWCWWPRGFLHSRGLQSMLEVQRCWVLKASNRSNRISALASKSWRRESEQYSFLSGS